MGNFSQSAPIRVGASPMRLWLKPSRHSLTLAPQDEVLAWSRSGSPHPEEPTKSASRRTRAGAVGLAILLAACSDAADLPVAAPGDDIIAQDIEGVTASVAIPGYTDPDALTRDLFTEAPIDGLTPGMDIDEAEPVLDAAFDGAGEGVRSADVTKLYASDGRTLLLATQEGVADDSIGAIQVYAEFVPISPLQTSLEFSGVRQKCARGSNTTEWTTEPCP